MRRYSPALAAYFDGRWRGTPLEPEIADAVQQVFLDCFREGGVLARADRGRSSGFRGFLYGVARVLAARVERRHGRRRGQLIGAAEGGGGGRCSGAGPGPA